MRKVLILIVLLAGCQTIPPERWVKPGHGTPDLHTDLAACESQASAGAVTMARIDRGPYVAYWRGLCMQGKGWRNDAAK